MLEKEILFQADLERFIGKRPFEKETTYQAFTNKKDIATETIAPEPEEAIEESGIVAEIPESPDVDSVDTKA